MLVCEDAQVPCVDHPRVDIPLQLFFDIFWGGCQLPVKCSTLRHGWNGMYILLVLFFAVMSYTDLAKARIVFSTLESVILWIVDVLYRNMATGRFVFGSPEASFGMRR